MKSDLPKVLVPVCGKPMVRFVIESLREAGVGRIVVVVGYREELVRAELADAASPENGGVEFVTQAEQLGTGHAVMMAREQLAAHDGPVVIVAGDSPMLQASSIGALLAEFDASSPACLLGTAHHPEPTGLGRIVRDANGSFTGVVEEKDATDEQRAITEVNMSTYVFNAADLLASLDGLTTDNAQAEYYVTDCPSLLMKSGKQVDALPVLKDFEALSINTVEHLTVVEAEMKKRGLV